MRPPEIDVTLSLHDLVCARTEDEGPDEPYIWVLGFKVDAETIGPPIAGSDSILPTLGVKVFEGAPAFPNLGEMKKGDQPRTIPGALGSRSFRLKPALLDLVGWFPGIAGIVCLLWDRDSFDPGTAEAGHRKFNQLFGPALSNELTKLLNGDYDDALSRDANNNVISLSDAPSVAWRLTRLRDAAGRRNAVKAITKEVTAELYLGVVNAFAKVARIDEFADEDDQLGVDAQAFLGDELLNIRRNFSLEFSEDDADYTVRGYASGSRVNVASVDAIVTKVDRHLDRDKGLWLQVCWLGTKLYWAQAFKVQTTTKFELRALVGSVPTSIRWFIDDNPIAEGEGSIPILFEPVDIYEGPPQDILASFYPGGPGLLKYRAAGPILEISSAGGNGVFYGKVSVVYAYLEDPSLFPPPPARPAREILDLGYSQETQFGIAAVELEMDDDYKADIRRCKRITDEIDRKHIEAYTGKPINPGDPPPLKQAILDKVTSAARIANAVGLIIDVQQGQYSLRLPNH